MPLVIYAILSWSLCNIYHRVIDAYIARRPRSRNEYKYFALQLFTVPTVSGHIARNHRLVQRLLAIITSFFTNRIVEKGSSIPILLPNRFKARRWRSHRITL